MSSDIKRLPDAELEVMLVIWKAGQVVNSQYILDHIKGRLKWQRATLLTVLTRLTEKGYLSCEKNYRNNLYEALISMEKYRQNECHTILEKLYNNSFTSLVASLYEGKSISKEELQKLQAIIDNTREER